MHRSSAAAVVHASAAVAAQCRRNAAWFCRGLASNSSSDGINSTSTSTSTSTNHSTNHSPSLFKELRSWARFLAPWSRYSAVYYPTQLPVAAAMLRLAGVGPSDTVYDLGCGDGRILVLAAGGAFNAARCVGVELDPELAEQARRAVSAAGLADRIEVVCGDAAAADVSAATVVALYLSSRGNESLIASIAPRLRPGTRVVSHYFPIASWAPHLQKHDTAAGIDLYLYSAP